MMTTCAVCGKRIVIPDPMFYVYKRGGAFFCSKNCMIVHNSKLTGKTGMFRTERKEKDMKHRLTRDQKQKAVEIALQGGDYMAYLKLAGAKNPSAAWWYIKATLEKADPEKYKELMKVMEENRPVVEIAEKLPPEAVAEVPEEDGGIALIPAEVNFIRKEDFKPKPVLEYKVTEIMTDLGAFKKDSRDGLIYWTTEEGEKVILTHREWNRLAESIPQIIEVLGGAE